MSLPKYPAYKDSGVKWLGEIPEGWAEHSLRHCLHQIFNGLSSNQIDESTETVPVTRIETISTGQINVEKLGHIHQSEARPDRLLLVGDILFSNINSLNMIGNCAQYFGNYKIYAGMNLLVLRPINNVDHKWLYWVIKCDSFRSEVESFAKPAINQASISQTSILSIRIPVCSRSEQTLIAQFLDCETAKIDDLIAEQEKLITLLDEKRQAMISHAVTKGLNPTAPMKDSGVEWLGEVPEHWEVKLLRFFADVLRGKFTHRPRNDPAFYDGNYPFIQTGDITGTDRYIVGYKQTLNEKGIAVSKEFPKGTLVMAIAANIGDVAILDFTAYFPDSIVGLVPNHNSNLMFMYYLMMAMKKPMIQTATVSTQMNLNVDQITALKAACPPLSEQQAIVSHLDQKTAQLDTLKAEAQRGIDLLKERRSALISAAVTGKIDVRHAVTEQVAT